MRLFKERSAASDTSSLVASSTTHQTPHGRGGKAAVALIFLAFTITTGLEWDSVKA